MRKGRSGYPASGGPGGSAIGVSPSAARQGCGCAKPGIRRGRWRSAFAAGRSRDAPQPAAVRSRSGVPGVAGRGRLVSRALFCRQRRIERRCPPTKKAPGGGRPELSTKGGMSLSTARNRAWPPGIGAVVEQQIVRSVVLRLPFLGRGACERNRSAARRLPQLLDPLR